MELQPGNSQEVMFGNIKELVRSGKSPKEAIAIALAEKRKSQMTAGGEESPPLPTEGGGQSALASALGSVGVEVKTEVPAQSPEQVASDLSETAKLAILNSKQKRLFSQR